MAEITTSNGFTVLIDDEDMARLSQFKWHAARGQDGGRYPRTSFGKGENGKRIKMLMSRLITHAPKGMEVDHINGNPLDNRRQNLRICTHQQNIRHRTKESRGVHGILGVSFRSDFSKSPWRAYVHHHGRFKTLGHFKTKEEALAARVAWCNEHWGEFAPMRKD